MGAEMRAEMSKGRSLGTVAAAYLVAIAAAGTWLWIGPRSGRMWLDTLIADLVATAVIFGFSRGFRNSSFYDAYWSVIPPLLLVYWWWQGPVGLTGPGALRCWLIAAVVGYWSVRLTGNWAHGFPGLHHEDWRYPLLRDGAGRWECVVDLMAIHVIPTVQVFVGMLPVYVAVTRDDLGSAPLMWLAFGTGVVAVTLELVADTQMRRFVVRRGTGLESGPVMSTGLWAWSRHPNYLGEIGFWLALAMFGAAAAPEYWWWLFAGVAMMVAMFLGASIPMMEKRSLERRQQYADVIDRVPKLLPRPPRAAGR